MAGPRPWRYVHVFAPAEEAAAAEEEAEAEEDDDEEDADADADLAAALRALLPPVAADAHIGALMDSAWRPDCAFCAPRELSRTR